MATKSYVRELPHPDGSVIHELCTYQYNPNMPGDEEQDYMETACFQFLRLYDAPYLDFDILGEVKFCEGKRRDNKFVPEGWQKPSLEQVRQYIATHKPISTSKKAA